MPPGIARRKGACTIGPPREIPMPQLFPLIRRLAPWFAALLMLAGLTPAKRSRWRW